MATSDQLVTSKISVDWVER